MDPDCRFGCRKVVSYSSERVKSVGFEQARSPAVRAQSHMGLLRGIGVHSDRLMCVHGGDAPRTVAYLTLRPCGSWRKLRWCLQKSFCAP